MAIVGRKLCVLATLVAVLLAFAGIAAAQTNPCSGTGSQLSAGGGLGSADPYTVEAIASVNVEGITGTQICNMNVVAGQGQQYLWLRYQEFWVDTSGAPGGCFVPGTSPGGDDCVNTITAAISGPGVSDTVTLAGTGATAPPADNGPAWIFLGNNYSTGLLGNFFPLWARTWARMIDVSSQTLTADVTYQFQVTNVVPGSYTESVSGFFTVGRSVQLIDPVLSLISNNQVTTDPESLAMLGTPVSGVAADSASQVVIRIRAQNPGQAVTLNLINDQGQISSNPDQDGMLSTIPAPSGPGPGGPPIPTFRSPHPERPGEPLPRTSGGSQPLQLVAVATNEGPMAFAEYLPPANFSRGGNDDTAASRPITITWQLGSAQGSSLRSITEGAKLTLWRPPVVLVHGLWGSPQDWTSFTQQITNNSLGLIITPANYDTPASITASVPSYSSGVLAKVKSSSLGFAPNAPTVLNAVKDAIVNFRTSRNAAATQADVIAHSMGGDITRLAVATLTLYQGNESFGAGNIHKLITVGTPHQGSPLAADLFVSSCTAGVLARFGKVALATATAGGVPNVSGGVGDLQVNSLALGAINPATGPQVSTALIAGTMAPSNLNGLNLSNCSVTNPGPCAVPLLQLCNDFLANSLTPAGWPTVFGGAPSDAVVPLTSQLNGSSTGMQVAGVIHSSGMELLGFAGPDELDPFTTIPALVIQLLNVLITSSSFVMLR